MQRAQDYYPRCPEAMIVSLARTGDRDAFNELVRRRQSSVRQLMRRCSSKSNSDITLADDLAQQVFLQVWLKLHSLKQVEAFGGWLKQIAISIWLQHLRKTSALDDADAWQDETQDAVMSNRQDSPSKLIQTKRDLDQALATLPAHVRLCIVLSYHEGMSHSEITHVTKIPIGTVKSHIKRGTGRLKEILSAYANNAEKTHE